MMKKMLVVALFIALHIQAMSQSFTNIQSIEDVCNLFPKSVAEIEERVEKVLGDAQIRMNAILAILPSERNFANTVQALDTLEANSDLSVMAGVLNRMEKIHPDKKISEAARAALLKLQSFVVDVLSMNTFLYQALCEYAEHGMYYEQLTDDQRYYIERRLQLYKLAGVHLSVEKQEVIKQLKKEVYVLGSQFNANLMHSTPQLLFHPSELDGVSRGFFDSLASDDQGNKKVVLSLSAINAILGNCCVADTRKKVVTTYLQRAYPANKEVLAEIIKKRDQWAKELGFAHDADFDLSVSMACSANAAEAFLYDLAKSLTQKSLQEFKQVTENVPDSVILSDLGKLHPWDYGYVCNHYRKKHGFVNDNKVAEYFPMEQTIARLFSIYEKFFNIIIKELPVTGLWDELIKVISIADADSGEVLGYTVLDLYARENKFSHSWLQSLVPATFHADGKPNQQVAILITNFARPTKTKPSLLNRAALSDFSHEFGHALHDVLGRTKMARFSGLRVKRDFLEMPSQLLEQWVWDKEILKLLSLHYQTGEQLSDVQLDAIIAEKNFNSSYLMLREIYFSLFSLQYFKDSVGDDLQEVLRSMHNAVIGTVEFSDEDHRYASFGHLISYGPQYYGYVWGKVLALDVFDTIKKEGLLNPVVGKRYVEQVIGQGGQVDPNVLLENFLGRKPNQEAFLRDLGV